MNWARNNTFLGDNEDELRRIFQYESRPTTVVRIITGLRGLTHARVATLETHGEWEQWLDETESTEQGLVLIMANREVAKSSYGLGCKPTPIETWLSRTEDENLNALHQIRATDAVIALSEKQSKDTVKPTKPHVRPIRALPLSQTTFKCICNRFSVHRSIVRTITRQNVPSFTCESVNMKSQAATVFTTRTPNSWPSDLALSSTHFPSKALTFTILYGTTPQFERDILTRLQLATKTEVLHPLLIPGILAELELTRHIRLVEKHINAIEDHVFSHVYTANRYNREEADKRIAAKSEVWQNLTYLRNSISTWSGEVQKMHDYGARLNETDFETRGPSRSLISCRTLTDSTLTDEENIQEWTDVKCEKGINMNIITKTAPCSPAKMHDDEFICEEPSQLSPTACSSNSSSSNSQIYLQEMHDVGVKFQTRFAAIRDEYEEKLRDCTMRLDGMAMATQWSHSETAVEIALATSQDSKVMRSISLVTMVFLPGTFFATVFSMTFFDWKSDSGQKVSSYLWVYIVVTLFFTAITLGLWYFFVIFRRRPRKQSDEEKVILLA